MSLEIRDNESKIFDELDNVDMNFVFLKDNFSNFINFNMDQAGLNNLPLNPDSTNKNLTNLDENLFDEFKSDAFQTEKKNLTDLKNKPLDESTPLSTGFNGLNQPPTPYLNQNFSAQGYEFSKKIKIVNPKMIYDEDLVMEKDEEFLKNLSDKQILKKMNVSKIHAKITFYFKIF
jgi:hypothetical protein